MLNIAAIRKEKPVNKSVQVFIDTLRRNAKDQAMADISEHFVRDAYNGNEELADILKRMMEAELKLAGSRQNGATKRIKE